MIVYAHRGDNRSYAENTAAAFDSSLTHGFRAAELDLRRLGDGTVVVFHDDNLRRLAGTDAALADLDFERARQIFPQILSGYEFVARYGSQTTGGNAPGFAGNAAGFAEINFEIKDDVETLHALEPLLRTVPRPIVSSFRHDIVDAAIELGFEGAYLVDDEETLFDGLANFQNDRVHVSVDLIPTVIRHAAKLLYHDVYVYTVNDPTTAAALYEHALFRGFFTDNPALLSYDSTASIVRAS